MYGMNPGQTQQEIVATQSKKVEKKVKKPKAGKIAEAISTPAEIISSSKARAVISEEERKVADELREHELRR